MTTITANSAVENDQLKALARQLAKSTGAIAVILFGSRARNNARPDSDYDLCLVIPERMDHNLIDPFAIRQRIRKSGGPKLDIIIGRPSDLTEERDDINSLAYDITRHGKLLFGQVAGLFEDQAA
jgi:predicted nucleotidyltransferase